jgi:hypothetical protein
MFEQNKAFNFFLLLFAFLCGNLFVLTYSTLNWGILLIFLIIFLLEFSTQFLYSTVFIDLKKSQNNIIRSPLRSPKQNSEDQTVSKIAIFGWLSSFFGTKEPNLLFVFANTMKRGFLLGFFIEAFKVGS